MYESHRGWWHLSCQRVSDLPISIRESIDELAAVLEAHISWYNLKQRQERLKGMAPMEYRHYALAA